MHNQYNPQGITVPANQSVLGQCDSKGNLLVALSSSGTSITASGLIKTGAGRVNKIIVSATNAGTIKLWDNTAASGTVLLDTMTLPAAGTSIDLGGIAFSTGLFATIAGTSATVTVTYN
jgi:hypothetical protein